MYAARMMFTSCVLLNKSKLTNNKVTNYATKTTTEGDFSFLYAPMKKRVQAAKKIIKPKKRQA